MTQPRDFTLSAEPHRFTIDADDFVAPAICSPITLRKIAAIHADIPDTVTAENLDTVLDLTAQVFRTLLPGPSGERFAERLLSETEPIDLNRQALPIMYWLLEVYGLRPTVPSSPSANGSTDGTTPNAGISSTDGASPETSTPAG